MIHLVDPEEGIALADYAGYAHLAQSVAELKAEAARLVPALEGRTVWMVNSTAQGGGVAEMLPRLLGILRDLGVDARWAVMGSSDPAFFELTKRIHNLIHGSGEPHFSRADRKRYEAVSRENADDLLGRVKADDVLVIDDPQPLGAGAMVKAALGLPAVWRCHIGLDDRTRQTEAVWKFLEPFAEAYDHAVFSAPEYIPDFLAGRASILHPAVDPLSHKNRELAPHKLMGVLVNAGLAEAHAPVVTPPFAHLARRLSPEGRWEPASEWEEIGLVYRPVVLQVSRWDRLKGFEPLLEAFVRLKARALAETDTRHRRRLELLRLVFAGAEPAAVADDPEALEVLEGLVARYRDLDPALQKDVALVTLPMTSAKENALMVNALQRCATVGVQNSLREGFGLTCTEAMWKRVPVVVSSACGLRQQVRPGLDGEIVQDPTDPDAVADALDKVLRDTVARDHLGRSAQRRVYDAFLVFAQARRWLETLAARVEAARAAG